MHRLSLVTTFAICLCATASPAALVVYDGFNYSTNTNSGNLIGATSLGGDFGWSTTSGNTNWTELRTNPDAQPNAFKLINTSKPTVSYLTTTGNAVTASSSTSSEAWRTLSTTYSGGNVTGTNKLWISFVVRKNTDGLGTPGDYGTLRMGNLAFGVGGDGTYSIEDHTNENAVASWGGQTPQAASLGESMMIIASIDFGTNGLEDTVKLYITSSLAGLPAVNAQQATMTFDIGSITDIGLIFGYGGAVNDSWSFDELRMAIAPGNNSTEDAAGMAMVAPAPEPSMLALPLLAFGALLRRRRARLIPAAT